MCAIGRQTPADAPEMTQSSQAVNIQARVSGWLDKRMYIEGSVVKAGQVLFQMDQKPFQAQVDAQQAALQRNQAALRGGHSRTSRAPSRSRSRTRCRRRTSTTRRASTSRLRPRSSKAKAQLEDGAAQPLVHDDHARRSTGVSSYAAVADGTYLESAERAAHDGLGADADVDQLQRLRKTRWSASATTCAGGTAAAARGRQFVVEIEMVDGNLFPYTGTDHVRRPVVQPARPARS